MRHSFDLNDYYYFVHVVEKGGFTRAAEALGIPKSRLSRHIVQLEQRLDATLIQRTTRQSKITELGEAFYQRARAALDQVELAEAELKRSKNALSGQVALSCSVGVAQYAIKELVAQFMIANPQVTVLQQVTNQNIDLIASGIDMSIRGHSDPLPDSTLIQRPLATVEWHLYASPDYPIDLSATPKDLCKHQTLCLGWQAHKDHWILTHDSGISEIVRIAPRLKSDDMATLKEVAAKAMGIVALPAYTCREDVTLGKLVRVLPQWHAGEAKLSLITSRRGGFSAPVMALQKFLRSQFAESVMGS